MTTADRLSARTVHTNPEHEDPHKDPKRTETSTVRGKPGRQRARRRHARCFPRPAARYQQRTVLKIQGASHTRSHDRVSAKGPPWMEMEREVAFVEEETLKASCWTPPWPRRCGRCAPACSRSKPLESRPVTPIPSRLSVFILHTLWWWPSRRQSLGRWTVIRDLGGAKRPVVGDARRG